MIMFRLKNGVNQKMYLLFRIESIIILGLRNVKSELCFLAYNIPRNAFKVLNINLPLHLFLMNIENLKGGHHQLSILSPLVLINFFYLVTKNNCFIFTNGLNFWIVGHLKVIIVNCQELHFFRKRCRLIGLHFYIFSKI